MRNFRDMIHVYKHDSWVIGRKLVRNVDEKRERKKKNTEMHESYVSKWQEETRRQYGTVEQGWKDKRTR